MLLKDLYSRQFLPLPVIVTANKEVVDFRIASVLVMSIKAIKSKE